MSVSDMRDWARGWDGPLRSAHSAAVEYISGADESTIRELAVANVEAHLLEISRARTRSVEARAARLKKEADKQHREAEEEKRAREELRKAAELERQQTTEREWQELLDQYDGDPVTLAEKVGGHPHLCTEKIRRSHDERRAFEKLSDFRGWLGQDDHPGRWRLSCEVEAHVMSCSSRCVWLNVDERRDKVMREATQEFRESVERETILDLTDDLLTSEFALGDGRIASWGEASAEDHDFRVESLDKHISGVAETAARHSLASKIIRRLGVANLNEAAAIEEKVA